jgi:ATP-binding cassette subfamily B multidrug efflux pump
MNKILSYVRPYTLQISIQFVIKFLGTIMDLFLPWLLSYIIDDVVPARSIQNVYIYGGLMVICAALALIFNIVANRMSIKTSRDITQKIRHDLFSKVSFLSSRQTDDFTIPSLISRLTSDTYHVHQMIDRMQRLGVRAPILLLGGIIITLSLEPVLALILILTLPILATIVIYVSSKGVKLYENTQMAIDNLVRKIQENMTGVRIIKALSKTDYEREMFDEVNGDAVKRDTKAGLLMSVTTPVMNLLLNAGLTLVVIVGAYRVNSGVTQPGKIIAFLSYFSIILNSLMMVTRLFVLYSKGAASAKRIEEVLREPEDMKAEENKPKQSGNHIEFKNVSFSYNKVQNNLTDISFSLKPGEALGIIGATGSGKSTLINLLMRFYDVDKGEILLSGLNIKSIAPSVLYQKFGVVFQNDFLLADTIRENISFGRNLPDEEIEAAAKSAQAQFIQEKEHAFSHVLTVKGANLSGGQKQRILIARALAANPEILILDDSSSALDYLTDAALRKALHKKFKSTTKIMIAQRISTIMNADKIIVLHDGEIIGYGTHEELLAKCDSYKEIYDVQMSETG